MVFIKGFKEEKRREVAGVKIVSVTKSEEHHFRRKSIPTDKQRYEMKNFVENISEPSRERVKEKISQARNNKRKLRKKAASSKRHGINQQRAGLGITQATNAH